MDAATASQRSCCRSTPRACRMRTTTEPAAASNPSRERDEQDDGDPRRLPPSAKISSLFSRVICHGGISTANARTSIRNETRCPREPAASESRQVPRGEQQEQQGQEQQRHGGVQEDPDQKAHAQTAGGSGGTAGGDQRRS